MKSFLYLNQSNCMYVDEQEREGSMQSEITGAGSVAANVIRLLIAGSQAGGLIGISGQNIAHIRNSSGATVNILAQNQLPPCALTQESDRVVQVSLFLQLLRLCGRYSFNFWLSSMFILQFFHLIHSIWVILWEKFFGLLLYSVFSPLGFPSIMN